MATLHLLYDFCVGTYDLEQAAPRRSEQLGPAPGKWYIFFGRYYQRDNEV